MKRIFGYRWRLVGLALSLSAGLRPLPAAAQGDPRSQLVGYESASLGTKQVAFIGRDDHVHEMFVARGGTWASADLTEITGAPLATGNFLSAYAWESQGTKQVVYATPRGAIIELYVGEGQSWQFADLTRITGAPPSDTRYLSGYGWDAGNSKQVVYTTSDGHIHELYVTPNAGWQHADLTQITGAPPATSRFIKGYASNALSSKQVVYLTADGHVHELYVVLGQNWQHADLTQLAGAPPASNDWLDAYSWEGASSKGVVYRTQDGHLHELYVSAGQGWRHADLTQITGAPSAIASVFKAYTWERFGSKQVVYKTATGAIEELYVTRGQPWRAANLTQIARGPQATGSFIDAYAWENGGSKQVVYPTSDGHIHELFVTTNSGWEHADLTQISRAPRMR